MPQVNSRHPVLALSALIFGHFLNHFYAYVLAAAMVIIRSPEHLDLTDTQVGLLGTIQMVVFSVCSLAVGIIGDRWLKSKKIFIPLGIILMSGHLFVAAYAQTFATLVIAVVIVGFGASFYHPIAYAAIADLYEAKKGLTMALNAGLGMIGTSITPGLVVSFDKWMDGWRNLDGWRNSFLIFGGVGLVIGVLLFISFNTLIGYNFTSEEVEKREKRKKTMTKKQRISNWLRKEFIALLTVAIISCLFYSAFRSGVFKILSQFLSIIFVDYHKYGVLQAGWITTIILVIGGLTAIIGGIVSDKYTTSITMLISLGGASILLLVIFLVSGSIPSILAVVLYFIFIAFLYFSAAAGTKYVAENVPQSSRSTGISFLFAFPNIIGGIFPTLFGTIKDNYDSVNNFNTFWGIGFLCLLAFMGAFMAFILFMRDWRLGMFKKKKLIETQ